jgi:hypothetical protein
MDAGYSLAAFPDNNGGFDIMIQNAQLTTFKGVLMYVVGGSSNEHLGSFAINTNSFKFSDALCSSEGVQAAPESTVTHSSSASKPVAGTTFNWLPNPGDDAKGPWTVQAVVSNGQNPYQILELPLDSMAQPSQPTMDAPPMTSTDTSMGVDTSMSVDDTMGSAMPVTPPPTNEPSQAPTQTQFDSFTGKTFKCRRIRSVHRSSNPQAPEPPALPLQQQQRQAPMNSPPPNTRVNNFSPSETPNKVSEFQRLANEIRAEAMKKYPNLKDTEAIQKYVADMLASASKKQPASMKSGAPQPQKKKADAESLRSREDFFGAF